MAVSPRQLAKKVRVETALGLLQEKRTAFAPNEIAHPEVDTSLLRLNIQPAGAFKFFFAVEIADAAIEVLPELKMSKAPVVIAASALSVLY